MAEIALKISIIPYLGIRFFGPTKKWANLVALMVQPISRKSVFKIFRPQPPPLKNKLFRFSTIQQIIINWGVAQGQGKA